MLAVWCVTTIGQGGQWPPPFFGVNLMLIRGMASVQRFRCFTRVSAPFQILVTPPAVLHDSFVLAKLILILLELREGILVVFFVTPGSFVQFTNRDVPSLLALFKAIMVYVRFYDTHAFMIFTDTGICQTK